jgi:hypothetical protein
LKFGYKNTDPKQSGCEMKIDVQHWALAETNVTVYPEPRVYEVIEIQLKKQYPSAGFNFIH